MNLFVSLKYLVALDDHKHFGRAALACHVTQPALSNALRALETYFETPIVKRGRTFAGFTDEGQRILVTARRMLREHEVLQQDLSSTQAAPSGHLTIGSVPTAMPIAARFAARLQARHPRIVPTLRSLSSVELETGLESLALDMALGYAERGGRPRRPDHPAPDAALGESEVIQYVERYVLLRRQPESGGAPVFVAGPMRWAEAATLPLCLLSAEMHNRTIVDRAFSTAGALPRIAIETNSILALALSVQEGEVCSIMPGALVGAIEGVAGLQVHPLVEPDVAVEISFRVHENNQPSPTLKAALALARSKEWLEAAALHSGHHASLSGHSPNKFDL